MSDNDIVLAKHSSTRRILIFSEENADIIDNFAEEKIYVVSYYVFISAKFLESEQKIIWLAYAGKFT